MKKFLLPALLIAILLPLAADAAWWNPFSRKEKKVDISRTVVATTTEESTISELDLSNVPTVNDLNKRIAELEDKLQKALSENNILKLRTQFVESTQASKKEEPVAQKVAPATGSEKQILAKVKPALVVVETATSSSSGVIIDAKGLILVPAHSVWIEASDKTVAGAVEEVSVILASGAKKKARLVGINELTDAAILQITDKGSYPFVGLGAQSAVKQGDQVYVAGLPSTKGGTGGEPFIAGSVSRKSSDSIEVTIDKKPLDNGGAIFDATGAFVGIPRKSTCKVLEEMKTCLKYSVTSGTLRGTLTQITEGMRLYKDKISNKVEELVRGQLEGVYRGTKDSNIVEYAISSVTGENSFDYFNKRLGEDQKGKITRLYLNKLMVAAGNIYSALDLLENQGDALRVFLINEEVTISELGDYQRKVLEGIRIENQKKLKEYQDKASLWSKKKNEYDTRLTDPSSTTHDYLMTEGVFVEDAAEYLRSEKGRILDMFSGEIVDIF